MVIKKVAIIGVTGNLGPWILQALVDSELFDITVLQRYESNSKVDTEKYPGVEVKRLPQDYVEKTGEVAEVLKGQDALVSVLPGYATREQLALATACCGAKVQKMIPADYDRVCIDTVPLYSQKKNVRDALQGMSLFYPGFSWTALINGHFLDYGLESPLLGFDISTSPPRACIFDGGDTKWSASSRTRIGQSVVKVLMPEHEQRTRNKLVYVESVNVTQNETLAAFEKVSGKKFEVEHVVSQKYIAEKKAELDKAIQEEKPTHDLAEDLVSALGISRANWQQQPNFMNEAFGFELEDIEDFARAAWEKVGKK